jgi:hypothetical protein
MDRLAPPVRRLLIASALATTTLGALVPGHVVPETRARETATLGMQLGHDVGCVEPAVAVPATLEPIAAERRMLAGEGRMPAEVDAELGYAVAAWTHFTYLVDARPRAAVVSELYEVSAVRREIELVRDEHDGIWARHTGHVEARLHRSGYTRDIWLLPAGTTFRGLLTD